MQTERVHEDPRTPLDITFITCMCVIIINTGQTCENPSNMSLHHALWIAFNYHNQYVFKSRMQIAPCMTDPHKYTASLCKVIDN